MSKKSNDELRVKIIPRNKVQRDADGSIRGTWTEVSASSIKIGDVICDGYGNPIRQRRRRIMKNGRGNATHYSR